MDDSSRHTQRDSKKKRKSSKQHYRDDESRDGGDSRAGSLSTDGDGRSVESSFDKQRRLRKSLRKAKRIAKHLEDLRLEEEEGDELDNFSLAKYPVREFKFTIPGMSDELALNPVVTLIGVVVLWSVVLWCTGKFFFKRHLLVSHKDCHQQQLTFLSLFFTHHAANPTNAVAKLDEWRTAISLNFTWLIQGTKVLYLVVALFVMCKYGHVKLGAKDEKPEFSTLAYAWYALHPVHVFLTRLSFLTYGAQRTHHFRRSLVRAL
jgi:BCCT, betaine/carnitine/choline family transporter